MPDEIIAIITINIIVIIIDNYKKFFTKIAKILIIRENLKKKVFKEYYAYFNI